MRQSAASAKKITVKKIAECFMFGHKSSNFEYSV